jgi:hypothetical protein
MLIYGLSEFWFHPFGGMTNRLADSSYQGTWFHNVFMDNARLGGIIPVFALVFATVYILSSIFKKVKISHYMFYFVSFITAFLLMQQDVVVEGSPHLLIIMYLTGLLMLSKSKNNEILYEPKPQPQHHPTSASSACQCSRSRN